ncbi:MAG: DUF1572 domain-containing protein [Sphaerobacteraceae bacterium]|nr:MAG: DUF1572 domain-containing protein [Sphaerobacteraceae bacterium]
MADAISAIRTGMKMLAAEHHQDMREIVAGRDADALNWRPGPETNSLAVLVIHLLGAEHSCVTTALGSPVDRDRDAEFQAVASGPDELLAEIDRIDELLPGLIDQITADDLEAMRTRPNDRLDRERPGIWWLLHSMRQSREHIGQMLLTIQLYDQQQSRN